MAGLYGVVSAHALPAELKQLYRHFFSTGVDGTLQEEWAGPRCLFGRSVIARFTGDRVFYQDETFILAFEGIWYNLGSDDAAQRMIALYRRHGADFVREIDGNFSGFLWDREKGELLLFTDHLNTKPLYCFHNGDYFIFASELKLLSAVMPTLGLRCTPDMNGVYSLMAFGYILNGATLIDGVEKLPYGTVMTLEVATMRTTIRRYFDYEALAASPTADEAEMIERIDTLLLSGVEKQWRKDRANGYRHYLFLSGGLDSRVNTLLAQELGYAPVTAITFAQHGSDDEKIAARIARDYGFEHRFFALDGGRFLEGDLSRFIAANDGMNLLLGSAAGFDLISGMDHRTYGTLHTGQIGDLLFGSYVKPGFSLPQASLTRDASLFERIAWFDEVRERYEGRAELFGYEQRVMHGTFNGDRTLSHFTDISSPFYDKALVAYCFGLPPEAKRHEGIYLKWFNARHPQIARYPWEQAGVRPTSVQRTLWGRRVKRYGTALRRRLGLFVNDMNPYDRWYRQNARLRETLDGYRERIAGVSDPQLRTALLARFDAAQRHGHYGRYDKWIAVTILLALELHFPEKRP